MNNAALTAILTGLSHPRRRIVGVPAKELRAACQWNEIGRNGMVTVDGVVLRVSEHHDSTTGETWFTVRGPKAKSSPLNDLELLTTPEEDFGDSDRGTSEPV